MSSLNYFNSIAQTWNEIRVNYFEDELKGIVIDKNEVKDCICADFGSGTGFMTLELAQIAHTVYALDQSKNMLNQLVYASKKGGYKNIVPIVIQKNEIPLLDNSVDYIYANMPIHHVDNPVQIFKEMFRILKPSGSINISDVEAHDGTWAIEEMHDVWLGFKHEQIEDWLRSVGFKNINIKSTGLRCKGVSIKNIHTETGIFLAKASKQIENGGKNNEI